MYMYIAANEPDIRCGSILLAHAQVCRPNLFLRMLNVDLRPHLVTMVRSASTAASTV